MITDTFHQATGAAQSALGSLTGSQADKVGGLPRFAQHPTIADHRK